MAAYGDKIRLLLATGPTTPQQLQHQLHISQPTLSRALVRLGDEIVRLGAARSIQYTLRDRHRGTAEVPVYRVNTAGQIERLGVLIPVRPDGFVMRQDDGTTLHSHSLPWWLLDMRPQGFLGRAYAQRHAVALGLPASVQEWSDTDALRALLAHGHDAVGNVLLGDLARSQFLAAPAPQAVARSDKASRYVALAEQAIAGDTPVSSAGGEQPKFATWADTPLGARHLLVKFSLAQHNPITQRWRDLLLAEHHALETLRGAGLDAVPSWIIDHHGQRFLEVERFDRVQARGRRGLLSLTALDVEFVGRAPEPWPVLVAELARQKVVVAAAVGVAQSLFAFGRLIGNTDMHPGNLSFISEGGRPYALAPAYDMLPMAFAPRSGGGLSHTLAPLDLHASVAPAVWPQMLVLARLYLRRLQAEQRFSADFAPCVQALESHLHEAARRIMLLA